jgi:hypothetical protein
MSNTQTLPTAPDALTGPSSRPTQPVLAPATGPAHPPNPNAALIGGLRALAPGALPPPAGSADLPADADDAPRKRAKRRKVNHACLYCRRSHMTCDESRPCQRWCVQRRSMSVFAHSPEHMCSIKREIGHLCHDEPRGGGSSKGGATSGSPGLQAEGSFSTPDMDTQAVAPAQPLLAATTPAPAPAALSSAVQFSSGAALGPAAWPSAALTPTALLYPPETLRTEFAVLTDFLETLDERSFFQPPASSTVPTSFVPASFGRTASGSTAGGSGTPFASSTPGLDAADALPEDARAAPAPELDPDPTPTASAFAQPPLPASPVEEILPAATKAERFLLTAADQAAGSRDERLNRVIRSKYEAGLLKPYNYAAGYTRLQRWMETQWVPSVLRVWSAYSSGRASVSQESKQAILRPISILRPKFRAIAQALTDMVNPPFLAQRT